MEERRKFVRVKDLQSVEVRVKQSPDRIEGVELKDMSINGVKFYYSKKLEKDQIVDLEISLPDGLPAIEMKAKVFWQIPGTDNKFTTGVRFQHENPQDKERLSNLIESRAKSVGEGRTSIRCTLVVDICISDLNDQSIKINGKSVDISNGGMKILLPSKLEIGAQVQISFVLPSDKYAIKAKALIVWVRMEKDDVGFSAGTVFTEMDNISKDIISKFIKNNCRIQEGGHW